MTVSPPHRDPERDPARDPEIRRIEQDVEAMEPGEARERMADLVSEVGRHARLYHECDAPEITDREYDLLYRELELLEARFPQWRAAHSPTRRVGWEPIDELEPFRREVPMLSLANVFDPDELRRFEQRTDDRGRVTGGIRLLLERRGHRWEDLSPLEYVVEPKLDGLAIEVIYERGRFTRAGTRGDGRVGEDVSHNLATVRNLPLQLSGEAPDRLSIRGEVLFEREDFEAMNRERMEAGESPFQNPRNAAAGTIRQLDPRVAARRPLVFVAHSHGFMEGRPEPDTEWDALSAFRNWGFQLTGWERRCRGMEEVLEAIDALYEHRAGMPFEMDGAVVKVNDRSLQKALGFVTRSPRWATAFKLPGEEVPTRLQRVEFTVGRTGVVTPVAVLDPVRVGGVTVTRATLHNERQLREELDLREGDLVRVRRAGDVIPRVEEVVSEPGRAERSEVKYPEQCPVCNTKLVAERNEVCEDGKIRENVAWLCPNTLDCPAQIRSAIRHFASRDAMDIEGLGVKLVDQLVDRGWVRHPSDLYDPQKVSRERLASLERMGDKSADNLLEQLDQSRDRPLDHALFALGIRHVGLRNARELARAFGSLAALREAHEDRLVQVEGIGPKVARSIRTFFERPEVVEELGRLQAEIRTFQGEGEPVSPAGSEGGEGSSGGPLEGRTLVLTGSLDRLTRREARERVEAAGGRVTGSVSSRTDYVVAGADPGSKLRRAERLGVPVIDEQRFLDMLSGVDASGEPSQEPSQEGSS